MKPVRYYPDRLAKIKCPRCGTESPSPNYIGMEIYSISSRDDSKVDFVDNEEWLKMSCCRCGYEFYIQCDDYANKEGGNS